MSFKFTSLNKLLYFKIWLPLFSFFPAIIREPLVILSSQIFALFSKEPPWFNTVKTLLDKDLAWTQWKAKELSTQWRNQLDCFLMSKLDMKDHSHWLSFHNFESIKDIQRSNESCIIITSHFGRLGLVAPSLRAVNIKSSMLTTSVSEGETSWDEAERWFHAKNAGNMHLHLGGEWITTTDSPKKIYNLLKNKGTIIIVMDGLETNSKDLVELPFLNGTLTLPQGILRISRHSKSKLIYLDSVDKGNKVEVTATRLNDNPDIALFEAAKLLENSVKQHPTQWWMWPAINTIWRSK